MASIVAEGIISLFQYILGKNVVMKKELPERIIGGS